MKEKVRHLLNDHSSRSGRAFGLFIQFLIVLSLITFSLSTLPSVTPTQLKGYQLLETITVIIFTIEYLARLWTAKVRWRYIFSIWGVVDLAAILPFYVMTGVDLRSVRIIRVLRIFRIVKMMRYHESFVLFRRAFLNIYHELFLFLIISGTVLYISALGIYYFEHPVQPDKFSSIFESLWWAIITLTTVGYGTVVPITTGGKIFTSIILALGLGIIAIPTGLIASALSYLRNQDEQRWKN